MCLFAQSTNAFILVLSTQPKELLDKWISQIPAGRICNPAELKGVCTVDQHTRTTSASEANRDCLGLCISRKRCMPLYDRGKPCR